MSPEIAHGPFWSDELRAAVAAVEAEWREGTREGLHDALDDLLKAARRHALNGPVPEEVAAIVEAYLRHDTSSLNAILEDMA